MAITWNNIAAPNFYAANELFKQAQDNLLDVGTTLTATAKGYQDAIRKRNTGLIQEYLNTAKTPEELQSESFKQGYANFLKGLNNEYDPTFAAQAVGQQGDLLTKRANDALTLKSNEFTFGRNQKEANTKDAMAELFTLPPELRDAKAAELAKKGLLDYSALLQARQSEGTIRNQDNANKLFNATYDATVEDANLKPTVTRQGMLIADRTAATAEKNARTNELEALARLENSNKEKNKNNYALDMFIGLDKVDKTIAGDALKPNNNPDAAKTLSAWYDKNNSIFLSDTDLDNIKDIIETDPKLNKLSDTQKVALAETGFQEIKNQNTLGRNIVPSGSNRKQAETVLKRLYEEDIQRNNDYSISQKVPIIREGVMKHMVATGNQNAYAAAKEMGLNDYHTFKAGYGTPLEPIARKLYSSSGSTLPEEVFVDKYIYAAANGESVDDLLKPNKQTNNDANDANDAYISLLKAASTGSSGDKRKALTGLLSTIDDPMQKASIQQELDKLPVDKQATTANTKGVLVSPIADTVAKLQGVPLTQQPLALLPNINQADTKDPVDEVPLYKQRLLDASRSGNTSDPILKAVKNTPYENVPMAVVLNASKPVPSPLLPEKHQTAPQTKANNLAVDLQSGKVEQTKAPVPMPNVTWAKPVVVERANPISNKLPQYKAVVTYVQDGDTVQLQSNDYSTSGEQNKIICRIDSINAPETAKPFKNMPAQAFSEESKRYLENLIKEGKVNIRIVRPTTRQPNEEKTSSNNYGRDVCQIEVSGADVTVEMIRAGAAMLYRRYNNDAGLSKLEDEAKANKRGLWGLPNPIDPETYSHSYR